MPEGDTVFRLGATLTEALAGRVLRRAELRHPRLSTVDLAGREVAGVRTVGKHLFVRFGGELSLHNHLRMDGTWHCYRTGERWRAPGHQARVVLECPDVTAVGFRLHDLTLLATGQESRLVGHLGPDLLDPAWSSAHVSRAVAALRGTPDREIGLALTDQTALAGIGNVYKVELCFLLGVSPWTPVSGVDVERAVSLARELLVANAHRPWRSTTGQSAPGRREWVYERTRTGCLRCGGRVLVADQGPGVHRRPTWYCPACQPGPAPRKTR
jgi:endonuclease-8